MGSEWKESTVGSLCKNVTSGGTPQSSNESYYTDGTIPWLNTKEVNFQRIYRTEKNITQEGLDNSAAKWIPENSVIVAMYGATAGKVATNEIPLTTNQACCNLIIDDEKADHRFVYYYLSANTNTLLELANGAAQQNLNAGTIKNFPIPQPPLPEQKAIAHILGTLDDKIELNRRMNATLEGMAQALFKSWFVDFDPVIDNALAAGNPIPDELAPRAEVRKKALSNATTQQGSVDHPTLSDPKSLFPAAFEFTDEMGWIPEGWEAATIADLCSVVTDGSHHSPKSVEKESGLPMASSKDLTDLGIDYESCRYISKEDFSGLEKNGCSPQIGDVLIAKDGARCGETCCIHVDEDAVVLLSSVAILRPKSQDLSTFLNTLMSQSETVADLRENYVSGSAIPRIILRDFKRFPVLTFPPLVLEIWGQHAQAIHQRAVEARNEGKLLSRLRDTLLPKLISGELQIGDSETLAEEMTA